METKIYSAISAVMKGITAISKNNRNSMQNFNYRSVDDVMNELHSLLAENGVFIVPEVLESNKQQSGTTKNGNAIFETRMRVKFTFYAEDGSSISAVVIGEAADSGDKGANKALSIAFKYVCLQIFCIPTEEEKDPDGQSYNYTGHKPAARTAPRPAPAKPTVQLKGGETTPEEKSYITALLQTTLEDGQPVYTKEQKAEYLKMRTQLTAQELIKKIENDLGIKNNSLKTLYEQKPVDQQPAAPEQQAAAVFENMKTAGQMAQERQPAAAAEEVNTSDIF